MADRSAAALLDCCLAQRPERAGRALATALADDPPLVLWAVCAARRDDSLRPHCLDDVAQWLTQHALKALRCGPDPGALAETAWAAKSQSCADHVCRTVQVAELAAQLAAQTDPPSAESAFLLGLLHDAGGWLAIAADPEAEQPSGCLPGWLQEAAETSAGRLVRLSARVLDGQAPLPDPSRIDLDACLNRGIEARRRWLAPVEGLGDWLPALADRLSRLEDLERRFQQQLETEKLEAMAEFAAGAGHEINNPLTVIAGRAQLLLRSEADPERRRGLALISAQAMRVYEMIADMMLFARPPRPEPEPLDLGQLVDRLVEELSPQAAQQEIVLQRIGRPGKLEIEGDPTQLAVALRAICQNSLEAIGRGGQIEIGLEDRGQEVVIRLTDDGPGIPPEVRRHLFDPYYSARQAGRGLGLGLSKCWRIITNHGGRIEVGSQPGQGACFTIMLPRQQS